MTGDELCELLDIDYSEIISMREQDAQDNIRYFLEELLKISKVRRIIKDLMNYKLKKCK